MSNLKRKLIHLPGINYLIRKVISFKASREANEIAHHFDEYLKPLIAHEPELRDEVHRIRHHVYCEELAFEPPRPDGKEQDDFDPYSIFCVIEHKASHNYAGCVRVVTPQEPGQLLPLEKFCQGAITDPHLNPANFPREKICEISRLAVPAEFRRRNADKFAGAETGAINEETYSETELRCFPFIAIGLYLSAASIVINKDIEHCFVMMEPRLARSMRFVGIRFKQIGPTVEYHGKRAPYYINPVLFLRNLSQGFKVLHSNLEKGLAEAMKYEHRG